MRVLSAESMREVDRKAIEELGIPSLVLMENAALGVVDALAESYPDARRIAIFCGPGNNGGDGFAVGRHLFARGYEVDLVLARGQRSPTGDAGVQLEICRRMGLAIEEISSPEGVADALALARAGDLVVDALFGTGLRRPLEGHFAELVEGLSLVPVPCLAVDLPSGLDASSPQPIGPFLQADLTVTFAAPKVAHILPPAARAVGELVVADLGIPPSLVESAEGDLSLLLAEELAGSLEHRPREGHKGSFGHLLVVAGSPGKTGAAVLAARAAVRGGAGLVTVAAPRALRDLVDAGCVEAMTLGVPENSAGGLSLEAATLLLDFADGKSAAAVGPGLGQAEDTPEAVRQLVLRLPIPVVLDADGLNAFAGRLDELARRKAPTVLTPHPGELGRLLGRPTEKILAGRLEAVAEAASRSRCVVILKGHASLVATPEDGIAINGTGNPGMATGGSGDVLTGLLGALLAQGYAAVEGSRLGTFLHGLAGDLAAAHQGEEALGASDLVDRLGEAFQRLRGLEGPGLQS